MLKEFLWMGGYGGYIWVGYGIAFALLIGYGVVVCHDYYVWQRKKKIFLKIKNKDRMKGE